MLPEREPHMHPEAGPNLDDPAVLASMMAEFEADFATAPTPETAATAALTIEVGSVAVEATFPSAIETLGAEAENAPSIEELVAMLDEGLDVFALETSDEERESLEASGIDTRSLTGELSDEEVARLEAIDRASAEAAKAYYTTQEEQFHRNLIDLLEREAKGKTDDEEDDDTHKTTKTPVLASKKK